MGYITDQDSDEVLHGTTHESLDGETIDSSKQASNSTCFVRSSLEGKFVMGSVHPNPACVLSASDRIEMIFFCIRSWSELIAHPEEAEWTSSGVEYLLSDCDYCVVVVLT
jgi:hypothetical protein